MRNPSSGHFRDRFCFPQATRGVARTRENHVDNIGG